MKICKEHWEQLREAIKERGLWPLVAKDAQEAHKNAIDHVQGEMAKYDPLMDANNMIWDRALKVGGLYLMGEPEDGSNDGHYCPLCEAKKHGGGDIDQQWIKGCTDSILEYVKKTGLLNQN